ncbi:hypothetical protein [Nannocystis punicea]|uniref:Uncharacterized protein n=1 Tax=Nannocystis punicea TaxID=2995304 RepID=A0ABY7HF70_9BACT|nr:hypothetical protein [Nannocystis poenicansa]WAS97916.1 hypothetical protein O0S08_17380 [Nannocystis poenicansa]
MVVAALVSVALVLQPPQGGEWPESCPEGATACPGGCVPAGEACPSPGPLRPEFAGPAPGPSDEETAAKIRAAWGCEESDERFAKRKLKWIAGFSVAASGLLVGGVVAAATMREPVSPREGADTRLTRQGLGVTVGLLLVSSALFLTAALGAMRMKRKRVECGADGCALRF